MSRFIHAYALDKYESVCESTLMYIYTHESGEVEITREGFGEKLKNAATAIWNTINKWIDKVLHYIDIAKKWIVRHWNAFVAKFKGIRVPNRKKMAENQQLEQKAVQMIVQQAQKDIANVTAQAASEINVDTDNFYKAIDEVLDQIAENNQYAEQNQEEIKDPKEFQKYMDIANKQASNTKRDLKALEGTIKKIDKHGKKHPAQTRISRTLKLSARTTSKAFSPIKAKTKSLDEALANNASGISGSDSDDDYEGTAV